jgi:predicted lipoprotein with Yx(FWY)xxD motif
MRGSIFVIAAFATALSAGLANAQPAVQAAPAGIHTANGALADAKGNPLYTFDWDTMKGMSHCVGQCARDWPPLKAEPKAVPIGDWTIISRDDGTAQWAYKDKPIYTYANDTAGKPGTGETLDNWKLAH